MATSTIGWQRVRIAPVERIVLADLAMRHGKSDEDMLATLIREAASRECSHTGSQLQHIEQEINELKTRCADLEVGLSEVEDKLGIVPSATDDEADKPEMCGEPWDRGNWTAYCEREKGHDGRHESSIAGTTFTW